MYILRDKNGISKGALSNSIVQRIINDGKVKGQFVEKNFVKSGKMVCYIIKSDIVLTSEVWGETACFYLWDGDYLQPE